MKINRLIITPTALKHPFSKKVVSRAKKLNPHLELVYSINQIPILPDGLSNGQRMNYLTETLLLATRSKGSPFNEIFASPGDIVENMGVMGKLAFHCPIRCPFCYINTSGRSTPWTRIYVDIDRFREELKKERLVHTLCLSLWSAVSDYSKKSFLKIPSNFKRVCDEQIRKKILCKNCEIRTDLDAVKYLQENLEMFFRQMDISVNEKKFLSIKNNMNIYYKKNKYIPLSVNIGEYTDILALDRITGYMKEILSWMNEDKDLRIKFRTKVPYLKNILNSSNLDRLSITIDLNTDFSISNFQPGTPDLNKRIDAINKLLSAGVKTTIAVEPIIKYSGFENDYKALFQRIEKRIDLKKIESIKVGCVRYKTKLKNFVSKNFPRLNLFDDFQALLEPKPGDKRWRYSLEDRVEIYSSVINSLKPENRHLILLGAEEPAVWKALNMDPLVVHKKIVSQWT